MAGLTIAKRIATLAVLTRRRNALLPGTQSSETDVASLERDRSKMFRADRDNMTLLKDWGLTIRGDAAIKRNLPPQRTTKLPQRVRIVVPIDYEILSQRYDHEVFAVPPNRHSSLRCILNRITELNVRH
jgi:hypothetical protein